MTPLAGVFPVICPGEEAGAGLAPACWPDQKPVHPLRGVTRHSRAARGSTPDRHRCLSPNLGWRSIGMLADQLDYVIGVDPHRDAHALRSSSRPLVWSCSKPASKLTPMAMQRRSGLPSSTHRGGGLRDRGTASFGAGLSRLLSSVASRCSRSAGSGANAARVARPTRSTPSEPHAACSVRNGPRCRVAPENARRSGRCCST